MRQSQSSLHCFSSGFRRPGLSHQSILEKIVSGRVPCFLFSYLNPHGLPRVVMSIYCVPLAGKPYSLNSAILRKHPSNSLPLVKDLCEKRVSWEKGLPLRASVSILLKRPRQVRSILSLVVIERSIQ